MDLKRAWRNGFLVSVIFAIPLSDLYYNQHSNIIVADSAKKTHVQPAASCGSDTSCPGVAVGEIDDIAGSTTSWDNSVDDYGLAIPGTPVTGLLLESAGADFGDIQKTAIQFDPQEIFQFEPIDEFALDIPGRARQNRGTGIGSLASSYGSGNSAAYAPGFSGPFMPTLSASGGKTTSAGLHNASADNSETPFVDPLAGSATQTEDGDPVDTPNDNTNSGNGDESLHNVPEPSSLVLITIGAIAVTSLLYRKSKLPIRRS